ncbi:MAG: class I SAM-dependent methyltransferase [Bacteroidetes bacterium]|nr:class I SAM-dependent methyltransferase [Bacteroidota bacterium]
MNVAEVKEYFEKRTLHHEAYFTTKNARIVELISFIDKLHEKYDFKSAIDIGCGVGITTEHLRKCAKRVVGTDLADKAIKVAKERNLYSDVDYIVGDFTELIFAEKFDLVCLFDVLEHILPEHRKEFLKNVSQHCSDIVAVSIPCPDYIVHLKKTNPGVLQIVDEDIRDSDLVDFDILEKYKKGVYVYYVLSPK